MNADASSTTGGKSIGTLDEGFDRLEQLGNVEEIEPRATFIRTYDGRRVEYDVGIGVEDEVERAKALILEAVAETGSALDSPGPEALTNDLDDYSVKLRVRWWIQSPQMAELFDARDKVLAAIKVKLLTNGIELPYPTHHVVFTDPGAHPTDQRSTR